MAVHHSRVTDGTCLRYSDGMQDFVAITIATALFAALGSACANAQTTAPTLMAPQAPSKTSRSLPAAKPAPVGRVNPCSIYGEGFVSVPGSDTCIKIGGYVRSDAAVNLGR